MVTKNFMSKEQGHGGSKSTRQNLQIRLLLILPTRNRTTMAQRVIESVLEGISSNTMLWVSDNSTDAVAAEQLRSFCYETRHTQIEYIRPLRSLSMGAHWNWLLSKASNQGAYTHVGILTDRSALLPHALAVLLKAIDRFPDLVISYKYDGINDSGVPLRVDRNPWTGRLVRLETEKFPRYLLYQGWARELPMLLNCVVPLRVLDLVRRRFGNICESIAPDVAFGCRVLAIEVAFLWLDFPIYARYGEDKSNGVSLSKTMSNFNVYAQDFLANLDARGMNYAAPIPSVLTTSNTLYHEYLVARSRAPQLPRINTAAYVRLLLKAANKHEDKMTALRIRESIEASGITRGIPYTFQLIKLYCWRAAMQCRPVSLCRRVQSYALRLFFDANTGWLRSLARAAGLKTLPVMSNEVSLVNSWDEAMELYRVAPMPKMWGVSKIERRLPSWLMGRIY
jgi:hypothetical protein